MSLFGSFWKKDSENARKVSSSGRWQVGDKIANRFEIHQILGGEGKSGMGIVYICYDHEHKTPYALKTFQEKYLIQEEDEMLFEREASIWIELEKHSNVVRAYFVSFLEERLFVVLEYITPDSQGRNALTHYLGNLSLPEILKFSIQFCFGMEYVYSKGIDAHRDIKPDNIMITPDKIVKITDFGLAKAFQELQLKEDIISTGKSSSLSIFQSKGKRICGTLPYMAPEQFDGYADKRSDIYSFGITLYQMVANGKLPFFGRTQQEWETLHKYKEIPAISSPPFFIIQRCLEKDPNKRYQDFTSLREHLQNFLLKEIEVKIAPPKVMELKDWELVNKGAALLSLREYEEALAYFDKAIDIDPRNVGAWSGKGVAVSLLGRYEEAIACYDKAIDMDPKDANAWYIKGLALENLRRYEEAIACYNKALKMKPNNTQAQNHKRDCIQNLVRNLLRNLRR